jgi:peptide/nickel transport system ATP-binding protein
MKSPSENHLQVRDLRVRLGRRDREVVRGLDIDVPKRHMLGLVGESGSGKSMALRAISRLMPRGIPHRLAGTVDLAGRALLHASQREARAIRAEHIGYVFQEPLSALNPGFRIGWQMREALRHTGASGAAAHDDLIDEALRAVGLSGTGRIRRSYPFELSGGMRQRVLIALALVRQPTLLLADEPTTALDVSIGAEILDLLQELKNKRDLSTILVSHDLAVVAERCDEVAVMYLGRVVERAPAAVLFDSPRHPYTRGLLQASVDVFGGAPRHLAAVPGEPLEVPPAEGCEFASRCPFAVERCRVETPQLAPVDAAAHHVACHRASEKLSVDSTPPPGARPGPPATAESASAGPPSIVHVDALTVTYPLATARRARREFAAVEDLSLSVAPGRILGVVGESGSGKSTLGRAVAGLQRIAAGSVRVVGNPIASKPADIPMAIRRDVQFIFQDPNSSLNPRMRVGTILDRALRLRQHLGRRERRAARARLLESVGMSEAFLGRYPRELSGGQRQRVAIARALAPNPKILVADEPTSALDVSIQAQILELLRDLVRDRGMTLVVITHDFAVIRAIADEAVVMHLGEIVERGSVDDIVHRPLHPYTSALVSAVPSWRRRRNSRSRLVGAPLDAQSPPSGCRLHPRCPYRQPDCETTTQALRETGVDHPVRCMFAAGDQGVWQSTQGGG